MTIVEVGAPTGGPARVSPHSYSLSCNERTDRERGHVILEMGVVRVEMDYQAGEGSILIRPGAKPADIGDAFREASSYGWEELTVDETGDMPETLEDGSLKLWLVPIRGD